MFLQLYTASLAGTNNAEAIAGLWASEWQHGYCHDNKIAMEDGFYSFSDIIFFSPHLNHHVQCTSKHLLSEYPCHFLVNAYVAFLLEWPCILHLKYCSDVFSCNALSGDLYLAAACYVAPCFEAQFGFRGAFCSTLPETLTFDSWQIPQMRSLYNWTFINHPLLHATKFPQPLFSSETFSKP